MNTIVARPELTALLHRFDERPEEWGPAKVRVTCADGSVVEGLLDGWDADELWVTHDGSRETKVAIETVAKFEGYSANMALAIPGGLLLGALMLAPVMFLSGGSIARYMFGVSAFVALSSWFEWRLSKWMLKWRWFESWASRWNVLYEMPRV